MILHTMSGRNESSNNSGFSRSPGTLGIQGLQDFHNFEVTGYGKIDR